MGILGMSFMCHKLKHEINALELEDVKLEEMKEQLTEQIGNAQQNSCASNSIFGNGYGCSGNSSCCDSDNLDALYAMDDQIEQRKETVEDLLAEKKAALKQYEQEKQQDIKDGAPNFGNGGSQ